MYNGGLQNENEKGDCGWWGEEKGRLNKINNDEQVDGMKCNEKTVEVFKKKKGQKRMTNGTMS